MRTAVARNRGAKDEELAEIDEDRGTSRCGVMERMG
jgi:hypothetical protein